MPLPPSPPPLELVLSDDQDLWYIPHIHSLRDYFILKKIVYILSFFKICNLGVTSSMLILLSCFVATPSTRSWTNGGSSSCRYVNISLPSLLSSFPPFCSPSFLCVLNWAVSSETISSCLNNWGSQRISSSTVAWNIVCIFFIIFSKHFQRYWHGDIF